MSVLGVIGGSGFYHFPELAHQELVSVETNYGVVNAIAKGRAEEKEAYFLPRHGTQHSTPPHKINYRANIAALKKLGVTHIIAFNASGGISEQFAPGKLVIPDQIIDYTHGRAHTFFDGFDNHLPHIEFAQPFATNLRKALISTLANGAQAYVPTGTYGCTQGPRLETAAEIIKLKNDGCDLVGMTIMPEAALAREKEIAYASINLIVNWAAGVEDEDFSLDNILALLNSSVPKIRELILKTVRFF